jgi:nitroreductase
MDRSAPAAYPIDPLLARRWSPRAFADRPVDPAVLRQLFEAARWAASCYNDQPWNYVVATREHPEEFQKMLACLMEGNQVWAKAAPVLAISVARSNFQHNGSPNRHAQHDVGAASACLALEAASLGLAAHQMGGFDADRARETYNIPAGFEPMAAIAIGYPGDPASLPDKMRQMETGARSRRPIADFVFSGAWASVAPFVKPGSK